MRQKFWFVVFLQLAVILFLGYSIYRKLNQKAILSVSPINPLFMHQYAVDGLNYFYEPLPGIRILNQAAWLPHTATITINADTLNDRFNYPVKKGNGIFRIITLGDSFTYGQGVDTVDNWTEVLEDKLNAQRGKCVDVRKFEVLNLGVDGYDIPYEAERYKIRGQKYNPDLIVWMVMDPGRLRDKMEPMVRKCLQETPKTENLPSNYVRCWQPAEKALYEKYGQAGVRAMLSDSFYSVSGHYRNNIAVIDFFNNHGAIIKESPRVKLFNDFPLAKNYFSEPMPNNYFLYDGHPSKEGHRIIAEEVYSYLAKSSLIPCGGQ